MRPDSELLRQYSEAGDEAAFGEVVRRHLPVVYGAAWRVVGGDAHLAEDVAQGVFRDLARKAGVLSGHATLVGWLHTSTRFLASKTVRGEQRRRLREQEAAAMSEPTTGPEVNWEKLQPVLDEAVGRLGQRDRDAVLLRFFQGKSYREVAAILGLQESAAHKRVERALEKLRGYFAKRGVTASAGLLAEAISAKAAPAVGTGLAAAVTEASLAGGGAVAGLAARMLFMTTNTKIGLAVAALALATIPAAMWWREKAAPVSEPVRVVAQGAAGNAPAETAATTGVVAEKPATDEAAKPVAAKARAATAGVSSADAAQQDFLLKVGTGQLQAFTQTFELTPQIAAYLKLTPEESARIKGILEELKKRVQSHEVATVQKVSPEQVTDPDVLRFVQGKTGQVSTYVVPPYTNEELAATQGWFTQSVDDALGPERGGEFMMAAEMADDVMFNYTDKMISFVDHADAQGNPSTDFIIQWHGPDGNGSISAANMDGASVPLELSYLFNAETPAPKESAAAGK